VSSYTTTQIIVTICENPEVYLTEKMLSIKGKEYPREYIRGCRVEEIDSFLETDLFYSNENGPGKVAFKGLNLLLGLVGALNIFRDFTSKDEAAGYTGPERDSSSSMDADPPLYCLVLLTPEDRVQTFPTINRLLLIDLAAKINRELGL
jgi:hypothetical protein